MRRRKKHGRDALSLAQMSSPPSPPSFWLAYLREHASPLTRRLHYFGTIAGVTIAAVAVASSSPPLAAAALVERNKPASFRAPIRSLLCDFRLLACAVTGRLGGELARAGVT